MIGSRIFCGAATTPSMYVALLILWELSVRTFACPELDTAGADIDCRDCEQTGRPI